MQTKGGRNNLTLQTLLNAISQPLLMHPEQAVDTINFHIDNIKNNRHFSDDKEDMHESFNVQEYGSTVVFSIDGALAAHHISAPCSTSPASYEGIKSVISDLTQADGVKTIVARINSGGGTASQNLDLSDFIFSQRGKGIKLIAMVDDMAYSAAYAIASAFDEIWITRTGGVGSVGVVSMHVNQEKFNENLGVEIEYIYAGDKKIFGNPNESLSDSAKNDLQKEVDRIYSMFTKTVARNLGMSNDTIVNTQAGTFHGEDAVKVGFATHMGTFDDLLISLESEDEKFNNIGNVNIDPNNGSIPSSSVSNEEPIESSKETLDYTEKEAVQTVENISPETETKTETKTETEDEASDMAAKQSTLRNLEIDALVSMCDIDEKTIESFKTSNLSVSEISNILVNLTETKSNINSSSNNFDHQVAEHVVINKSWNKAFKKVKGYK
jgi:signal peptide peptidase SppA